MSEVRRSEKVHSSLITIQLGKKGITDGFLEEVRRVLKKRGKVKIKILKSARTMPRKEIAEIIAKRTGAKISKIIGYTIILEEENR